MSVFSDFPSFRSVHEGCVATIGKYDGMHVGHQHVLKTLCHTADIRGLPAVVIVSEPHPEEFFSSTNAAPRLMPFQEKVDFLLSFGINAVFRMTFDNALCNQAPTAFIQEYLIEGLGVKAIIVGDDFRFGKNRKGDFQLLQKAGRELGFEVIREIPFKYENHRVSSTLVRNYLEQGDCEKVRSLLGRYYSVSGRVETGKKLGRELGTPTANIDLEGRRLPLHGIFSVLVEFEGKTLQGIASVGFNPTVENSEVAKLEVYIFDFDKDIYGERLVVSFIEKLRDELKFPDLESLKQQMVVDIEQARQSLQSLPMA